MFTSKIGNCIIHSTRVLEGGPRVAVVGSRDAETDALAYAKGLAGRLASAGAIVLSGGARGIDTKAHEGALEAPNGKTWVIAPNGSDYVTPPENKELFERIEASPGAMVWPFPPDRQPGNMYQARNATLVALTDIVVVVQAAKVDSGTFSTAKKTLNADKPLWVVPLSPWSKKSAGSRVLLRRRDIKILWDEQDLFRTLELMSSEPTRENPDENAVLRVLSTPRNRDEILGKTNLSMARLAAIVFTLQIEGLIKERLDGRLERL